MKLKALLTPVKSVSANEAREMMERSPSGEIILLDVRQPSEYEKAHIPGSLLMPLPELTEQWDQLEYEKTILVY